VKLDQNIKNWLGDLADKWKRSPDSIALEFAETEIENRMVEYPMVKHSLEKKPFVLQDFANAARKCWILHYSFDAMHFNVFIDNGEETSGLIQTLIDSFPSDDDGAAERIDRFVEDAILLGYSNPKGGFDFAGACQLASLILTSVMPDRFVDYRRSRWVKLASLLGYPEPEKGSGYGKCLVWAGNFALNIAATQTFREYWPRTLATCSKPLWVISGLCWGGMENPERPESDPIDPEKHYFPEGALKRKLHYGRERNGTVISRAKALALKSDPYLHCDVCGFSFVKHYGSLGAGFIEAHHTTPVSELKSGGKTSVDDLAMLCSNCHCMVHRGDKTLTIEELKLLMQQQRNEVTAEGSK
jgi:hypothetical protein